MPDPVISWPHAPIHQLSETGTYFVTAGTYLKAHYFRAPDRLDVLHRGLLKVAQDFSWQLEAWAVFSNHYHFIARSPEGANGSASLSKMLNLLHRRTAIWVNRLDKTPGRKSWHNFWDTKLTYQKSYLARLSYVHQNQQNIDSYPSRTNIRGVLRLASKASPLQRWSDPFTDSRSTR